MPFLGTLVNFFTVLLCGFLGSFVKKGVPERISQGVMSAVGVCVVYIGIDGILEKAPQISELSIISEGLFKILVMIISMAVGTLIGELIDIDKWVGQLGGFLEKHLSAKGAGRFTQGFVSCSILFCVGAMAVNGAIQDAMCKPDILLAKSVIDGIVCFVMASSLGIGCAFSAFFVLAYQGALTLLGLLLTEFLPAASITYMSVTGSLVILLIGTNLLGITKVKTANMIPAIFLPILLAPLLAFIF